MKRYYFIALILWLGAANADQDDPNVTVQLVKQQIEQQTSEQASPKQVIVVLHNGMYHFIQDLEFGHALRVARDALEYAKQELGAEHTDTRMYQQALAKLEKVLEPEQPKAKITLDNFAAVMKRLERIGEALSKKRSEAPGTGETQ